MLSQAQFVIVDPTVAVGGMVKFTSKYRHWVGNSGAVSVTVTMFPVSVAFRPDDTAPRLSPVNDAGMVSVMVAEVMARLPELQSQIWYFPEHPGWPLV